ncbi:MAG: response regulator transcription factor [Ardenticatenaceae bacterium]|nr:response regulator transcription factor [Anaerolineales bacterium]MCB8977246.1 response regulator transcription factor [Ardenticatenaceae bacterium]
MSEPIRIVIADDHPLFREGVAQSLSSEPGFTVVGQAGSGEEACSLVSNLLPDVLLLDVTMPGDGGIVTAGKVAAAWPVVRIMMLTVSEDQDTLMAALKAGARGYVLKGVTARDLTNAVRVVAGGDIYISPALAGGILFELTASKQSDDPITTLTDREREILGLVAGGLTNREIGDRLHLAEKTIKHYMTNVLQKLQVRSRVEAALLAQKHGLHE